MNTVTTLLHSNVVSFDLNALYEQAVIMLKNERKFRAIACTAKRDGTFFSIMKPKKGTTGEKTPVIQQPAT